MARNKETRSADCVRLEPELVLFHYGELGGIEHRQVEAHLRDCTACSKYLLELADFLPRTVLADDPPQQFWQDYSRELRHKLAAVDERRSWWQRFFFTSHPWALPALATSAVVLLALTFTLGKGFWRNRERPPFDDAFFEVLPVAENLDFYKNLELLDAIDLLEFMGEAGDGAA
jgi:hypothetical protein